MAKQIYVHGFIGSDWYYGDGVTYKGFKREFDAALASGEEIEVRINTPGGSIMEGVAIYNLIAQNRDRVTTVNEGFAYSMGSIILSAGSTRKAYKNSTTMVHNGSGSAYGNAKQIRGSLEMLEKLDDAMALTLAEQTGKTKEEITATYFDYQDHTLSAQEALDAGIITEIIDLSSEAVPEGKTALKPEEVFALFAAMQNKGTEDSLFKRLSARFTAHNIIPPVVTEPNNSTQINDSDMKLKLNAQLVAFAAIAGITAKEGDEVDFTAEHFEKINTHIGGLASQLQTANDAKATAEGNVTRLTGELTTAQDQAAEWKKKYEAMPGAVHTTVETPADPAGGPKAYDWTKSGSKHAKLANSYLGS